MKTYQPGTTIFSTNPYSNYQNMNHTETYHDKTGAKYLFVFQNGVPVQVWKDNYIVKNCNRETSAILLENARSGKLKGTGYVSLAESKYDETI